ncbi:MAG: sulfatase-like hydrolase/transferase [Planctomycetes bacterium]|nr:sulfatase-like hydrolase/transferase [Planctomycetota bacterium]
MRRFLVTTAVLMCVSMAIGADKPNIVYILADDLGYGDVHALNAEGKIATPHMDQLAATGMTFTDAHSSSAVCTPTRYGILTGRYNWRSRLQHGVLGGYSTPLIEKGRMTVASMLKAEGYATGCFGKWHLGMNWPLKEGGAADDEGNFGAGYKDAWKVDYAKPIQDGPIARGFDEYFGISASLDMPPYLFIDNDRSVGIPTKEAELWAHRKGPVADDFKLENVLPEVTKHTVVYIEKHAADAKAGKPFFIYMPLPSPHTPIAPNADWKGKSGISDYADYVMETDWAVGEVLAALDKAGLAENTLVIVTSDNGCSPSANFKQLAEHGHNPSYIFRGEKADIFEGGHHIPFIARWPGKVAPGSKYDETICLTDLMATAAEITGAKIPDNAGEDSVSILPALVGKTTGPIREATVHHSINGSFSLRQGNWKLEMCASSGGWSGPRPGTKPVAELPDIQLYDLSKDIAEKDNVEKDHPEVVAKMKALLEKYIADGRSTPGSQQSNDVQVDYKQHIGK